MNKYFQWNEAEDKITKDKPSDLKWNKKKSIANLSFQNEVFQKCEIEAKTLKFMSFKKDVFTIKWRRKYNVTILSLSKEHFHLNEVEDEAFKG